jgi:hypothetical protein
MLSKNVFLIHVYLSKISSSGNSSKKYITINIQMEKQKHKEGEIKLYEMHNKKPGMYRCE